MRLLALKTGPSPIVSWQWAALLCLLAIPTAYATGKQVGESEFARGTAAARQENAGPRILGKGAPIYERDVIQTGPRSFVVLKFQDAGKLTLRPNSKLTIDTYLKEQAQVSLHTGGVRAQSGAISKTRPGAFRVKTPAGTVQSNGADFDARLCEQDCEEESSKLAPEPVPEKDDVVGRVALLRGTMHAVEEDGTRRSLATGAPLLEKELMKTGAATNALLVFRDDTRVTLQQNAAFQVEAHAYYTNAPGKNQAAFKLFEGGMRTLTGAIGKTAPDNFRVSTPVATTGIRGTGFDLVCQGKLCVRLNSQAATSIKADANLPDGLYSNVWSGIIFLGTKQGTFDLGMGQSGYIGSPDDQLIVLPFVPGFMADQSMRPDKVKVNLEKLFGKQKLEGNPPGLYVQTRQGHVQLVTENGAVDLGKSETGYANFDGTILFRLQLGRNFLSRDPVPIPTKVNIGDKLSILVDELNPDQATFECLCPI